MEPARVAKPSVLMMSFTPHEDSEQGRAQGRVRKALAQRLRLFQQALPPARLWQERPDPWLEPVDALQGRLDAVFQRKHVAAQRVCQLDEGSRGDHSLGAIDGHDREMIRHGREERLSEHAIPVIRS